MKLRIFFGLCLLLALLSTPFSSLVWAADITANSVLKRGTILTHNDISVSLGAGEKLDAVHTNYIGMQLTRTVYAGHKIETHYLSEPVLVKRNAQVSMIYTFGAMQLSAKGRALQAGAKGETITVMNTSSRKKITAIIISRDLVEVSG
ncbi:MAG: flagella basal body P-ring formation protein FlgA [Robiginitomaculum sp.]|nr:MAG: flagella basal body P-ring formation protein FlgA [Robiginitomaculum sp.]